MPSRHAGRLIQIPSRRETPFLVRIFAAFGRVTLKRLETVQKNFASRLNRLESVQHFRVTPEAPRKRLTLECLAHYVLTTLRSCLAGCNHYYTRHLPKNVVEWQSHGPGGREAAIRVAVVISVAGVVRVLRAGGLGAVFFIKVTSTARGAHIGGLSVDCSFATPLTSERLSSN